MQANRSVIGALAGLSAWAIAAPYADSSLGFDVAVRPAVEVVDHVVPGLVVIAATLLMGLVAAARLPAALAIAMAGLWMTATHLPLVTQAQREGTSMAAAAWHTGPGLCLLVLGVGITVVALQADGAAQAEGVDPSAENRSPR